MYQKSGIQKTIVRLFLAGILLTACTGMALAASAITYSPASGSSITSGTPIIATVDSPHNAMNTGGIQVTLAGNTVTSGVPEFNLPFTITNGALTIQGSNIGSTSLAIEKPDGGLYTSTFNLASGSYTVFNGKTISSGSYQDAGTTITATGGSTSLTVSVTGATTDNTQKTLTISTTGANVGSTITVNIGGQSATYTIIAPSVPLDANTVGSSGDGAPAAGAPAAGAPAVAGAQRGALQQGSQTSTVSVSGTGAVSSGTISAGSVDGMTGATTSWSAASVSQPASGASITTAISQTPPAATLAAFQSAYQVQGKEIGAVAYTMTVTKSGVTQTGPATITMSVPLSWAMSQPGGLNAIGVVRQADDGTVSSLSSTYSVDQTTGMVTYTAQSPNGLCIFAIVSVTTSTPVGNTTVTSTSTPAITNVTTVLTTVPTTSIAPAKATAESNPLASVFAPLLNLMHWG